MARAPSVSTLQSTLSSIPHDRLSCHSVFSLVNIVKVMVIVSCLSLISSWLSLLFLCFSFVSWQFSSLVKIYHYGRNHIHLVKTMKYSQSYGHKHLSWSKLLNIVEAMVIIMKVGQCCEIWSKLFVKYIRIKYICKMRFGEWWWKDNTRLWDSVTRAHDCRKCIFLLPATCSASPRVGEPRPRTHHPLDFFTQLPSPPPPKAN